MEKYMEVERSIHKKYRKELWNRFIEGVKQYEMVRAGDRIAVCISGGKDSMLLAKLMQELERHGDVPIALEFLVMDPGYSPQNRQRIIDNAALLHIPIQIFDSDIFRVTEKTEKSPCYLCARMRRGHLYKFAQSLGCNKIALGHHFNDVIETTLMGMLYGGQVQTMLPKLHSTNFAGMELIRPLYCVRERDILAWKRYNGLEFLGCACSVTERDSQGEASTRQKVKRLIETLRREDPQIERNIFRSVQDVNLATILGYHRGEDTYCFLDDYDRPAGADPHGLAAGEPAL